MKINEKIIEMYEKYKEKAMEFLDDDEKLEQLLENLEEKLKLIPGVGEKLADVPALISMLRAYMNKTYREVPAGTVLSIIATLLYVLSPLDIVPDGIPVLGIADDILLVDYVMDKIHDDVEKYRKWKQLNQ